MAMLIALSPGRGQAEERSNTLLLIVAAPADESARLEAVTRELLQPLDVQLELRRVSRVEVAELRRGADRRYFARAWIALSATGSARLYLEHGASDRLLVRDLPADSNNPELVREELGHILQAAVEGLKAGENVGEPREQALEQVVPAAQPDVARAEKPSAKLPAEAEPRTWWRIGARYEVRWLGEGARFEDGPEVVVALATRLGFELGASYRRPFRIQQAPIGARLETVSLRALATLEPWRRLRLGAGLGADFVHVTPVGGVGMGVELADADWLRLALGRVQVGYGYRPWRWCELLLTAGADVDVSGTRYVVQRASGDVAVLNPAPLRPFVSIGAMLP